MTEQALQIKIIEALREYYMETNNSPDIEELSSIVGIPRRALYDLFPKGLIRSIYMPAGVPFPSRCQ